MGEPSSQEHGSEEPGKSVSIMRSFLDSKEELVFTDEIGVCGPIKNHCVIGIKSDFPLNQAPIFKGDKCCITRWEVGREKAPTFSFRRPFVTKKLVTTNLVSSELEEQTKQEVSVMKNLRHPHVAVFLGTWKRYDRLNILIFPAACFDLGKFMGHISGDLEELLDSASRSGDSSELEPSTALLGRWSGPLASPSPDVEYPCLQKLLMIQRYFGCLSQALTYIHKQGVRHKDIKPTNILIDGSGSAVVTDFGISKYFDVDVSHDTKQDQLYTRKYCSPEMAGNEIRGDASDVYSLGCVFLEMATLLLGKTLKKLDEHCTVRKDADADVVAPQNDYYLNLKEVYDWFGDLENSQVNGAADTEDGRVTNGDLRFTDFMSHKTPWHQNLRSSLEIIQKMMARSPVDRPEAAKLWACFMNISPKLCRDCDPRHQDVWKPTAEQEAAANEDLDKRRSLTLSSDAEDINRRRRRDAPTASLELLEPTSATSEVKAGNETHTNPETVDKKTFVLIHDHEHRQTYCAPFHTLKGVTPPYACLLR